MTHANRGMASAIILSLLALIAAIVLGYIAQSSGPSSPPADGNAPKKKIDRRLINALEALSPNGSVDFFALPDETDLDAIPQHPNNPLTHEKIALGKLLYHETGLLHNPSRPEGLESASCATCHHVDAGFQAGNAQGIGEGGLGFGEGLRFANPAYDPGELDVQPLRSPTTLNGAFQRVMLWNGQFGATGPNVGIDPAVLSTPGTPKEVNTLGFDGLEAQAIAGSTVHRLTDGPADFIGTADLSASVTNNPTYQIAFDLAFPDVAPADRMSVLNSGLAIAAYERTLLATQSPWQRWLRGDRKAMTSRQKRGALLFFGKADCATCHTGPALNSETFHALGMNDLVDLGAEVAGNLDPNDGANLGRGGLTGLAEDMRAFKTPQLYNLADSPFYGHGASLRSVKEVLAYKNDAVAENPRISPSELSPHFQPLGLSKKELRDLEAFISDALYDPNLGRYVPELLPTGLPFPVNDPDQPAG